MPLPRPLALLALTLSLTHCTVVQALREPAVSPTGPLEFETIYTGGATPGQPWPTVVALHGRGDSPANFAALVRDLPVRARVLLPRAPNALGTGWSWFRLPIYNRNEESMVPALRPAAERVAGFVRDEASRTPTCGRPVLAGFSQGAIVTLAVAAQHPELLSGAVAVAGALGRSLMPAHAPPTAVPITLLHGTTDPTVPYGMGELTTRWLTERGFEARIERFDGVEHRLTTRERNRFHEALVRDLARACPPQP